jgi:adenylate cyclase
MARNSTFTYKDKPTDVRQVGRDLNVRYVLEGSIQRANQQVRVTAQLIDATTGRHIWAERYDRQVDNIFAIRDDITRSIAGTLGSIAGVVTEAEAARISAKDPNSFTAYDYLMKGWDAYNKFNREDNAAARRYFEQAMAIDPNYARAYAGLSWTHELDYDFEWTDDDAKSLKLALDNSLTAVERRRHKSRVRAWRGPARSDRARSPRWSPKCPRSKSPCSKDRTRPARPAVPPNSSTRDRHIGSAERRCR